MSDQEKLTAIYGFKVFPEALKLLLNNPLLIRYAIYSMIATVLTFILTCVIFYFGAFSLDTLFSITILYESIRSR